MILFEDLWAIPAYRLLIVGIVEIIFIIVFLFRCDPLGKRKEQVRDE